MLPVIASMVMGGLFKQSTNQMQAGGFGGGNNPLGEMIEEMMRKGGGMMGGQPQRQAPHRNPLDNPFGKMLEGMFGGGAAGAGRAHRRRTRRHNPFGKMFEEMMRGGQAQPEPEPEPEAPPRQSERPPAKSLMTISSARCSRPAPSPATTTRRASRSIFDQFTRGMDRNR